MENINGEKLAIKFHKTYERLAPLFGYKTREDTRDFDPESANGKLMIAVCTEIAHSFSSLSSDVRLTEKEQYGIISQERENKWK